MRRIALSEKKKKVRERKARFGNDQHLEERARRRKTGEDAGAAERLAQFLEKKRRQIEE